jgi:hypothetical protein
MLANRGSVDTVGKVEPRIDPDLRVPRLKIFLNKQLQREIRHLNAIE